MEGRKEMSHHEVEGLKPTQIETIQREPIYQEACEMARNHPGAKLNLACQCGEDSFRIIKEKAKADIFVVPAEVELKQPKDISSEASGDKPAVVIPRNGKRKFYVELYERLGGHETLSPEWRNVFLRAERKITGWLNAKKKRQEGQIGEDDSVLPKRP